MFTFGYAKRPFVVRLEERMKEIGTLLGVMFESYLGLKLYDEGDGLYISLLQFSYS
jgi:hypothetical protein